MPLYAIVAIYSDQLTTRKYAGVMRIYPEWKQVDHRRT
jgi:hypothetical protein